MERTDSTVSLRLNISETLFVQAYLGELTGSLYFALVEHTQRIFGIDRESGLWHMHPVDAPHEHQPLPEGMEPKPLLRFLSKVEELLVQYGLV